MKKGDILFLLIHNYSRAKDRWKIMIVGVYKFRHRLRIFPSAMSLPGAFSNDHSIAGTHCRDVLLDVTTSPCLIPKVEQSSILRQETHRQRSETIFQSQEH
jgi:hypothetical protein